MVKMTINRIIRLSVLAYALRKEFFISMIKIPAFIIGGLLILTGIAGYLLQDPGLSLKIKGPLAADAQLTLSDGNQSHELDLGFASSEAAGEHAYWIIYNLNLNHAKDASQGNYAIDEGATDRGYVKKSFWYASSKGETMDTLIQESENYQGAGDQETIDIDWAKVDQNSSTIRFVFKNQMESTGPITLQASNWKNIDITPEPKPNEKIEFKKSWTAFIPGILGIILILLTLGASKMPHAHKHFMHVAVLVGLVGFFAVAGKVGSAVAEMNWLKEEPYMIIHVSSLKPTTMLLSAGLLLIFVILCVVSFIEARKNRIAEEKKKPKTTSPKKENSDKKDLSKDSDKKEVKEKDSGKKEVAKESNKEDESSQKTEASKPQAKKEPAKTEKDTPEQKKEETPTSDKKPSEAPKASTDIEEKKSKEPIKETPSSKDSSSSDSNSKDQDDSKEENEAAPKSEAEDKNVEKSKPKSDSDKSKKEDNKE